MSRSRKVKLCESWSKWLALMRRMKLQCALCARASPVAKRCSGKATEIYSQRYVAKAFLLSAAPAVRSSRSKLKWCANSRCGAGKLVPHECNTNELGWLAFREPHVIFSSNGLSMLIASGWSGGAHVCTSHSRPLVFGVVVVNATKKKCVM